mmetsp:Transcript_5568/g.15676  ORF Transcript_5568/g.15676 Transcript_5568/m.15676 type:complete len:233 (-) Transcript_5568:63-761(-)|eukprot:CAMPEP_0181049500 /NCGR_PEP_ID=MMETSP1070-20121207/16014_1 /TAXON_ID=265543 /ORGANISM="Minutocellus polymorphus, Strain NH13" /LENGTH=232 /DNA_ID=CAMNT_0023128379 /DNA_START=29 /DNA_END=727 /DNA_ORIENTATION=-
MKSSSSPSPQPGKPFLEKLESSNKVCGGLYLFDSYLSHDECAEALKTLDSEDFPWDISPKLYGQKLTQHDYQHYQRSSSSTKKKIGRSAGLQKLEQIAGRIEMEFDGKITDVYCNRFQDPTHNIEWHKDTYGRHIFVLSLGSRRTVQFRNNKSRATDSITPKEGDLYFMPLAINSTHIHRVCSAEETSEILGEENSGTRLSFVFFFESPKYANEFKISKTDRFIGFVEDMLS